MFLAIFEKKVCIDLGRIVDLEDFFIDREKDDGRTTAWDVN